MIRGEGSEAAGGTQGEGESLPPAIGKIDIAIRSGGQPQRVDLRPEPIDVLRLVGQFVQGG